MTAPWPAAAQSGRTTRLAAAAAALALHGAAVWLLLPHGAARTAADAPPTFEIALVNQPAQTAGAPAQTPPPSPSTPPPSPPNPPEPAQPASVAPDQTAPDPAPPPPTPQQTAAATATPTSAATPPKQPAAPAAVVNLSGDDSTDQEALNDRGDNVVPPRPDATYINKPPHYPLDAARRRAEGTVTLIIHITEAGIPAGVDIAQSSGDPSLDRSAADAAALWRFQPATDHGVPVPIDLPYRIVFGLGHPAHAFTYTPANQQERP